MKQADKADEFERWWALLAPPTAPAPEREYPFVKRERFDRLILPTFMTPSGKVRAWRYDFAWPEHRVAVEIDGGQWVARGGRHATDGDRDKLNAAAILGWRVLRYSPSMLASNPQSAINEILEALQWKP